jgi:hypothetical protein
MDLAVYQGTFNNLDQNFGSYMSWQITFGDPSAPYNTSYAPFGFDFDVAALQSFGWTTSYLGLDDVRFERDCSLSSPIYCEGSVDSANYYIFASPTPSSGIGSQWYFTDEYYPGNQSFTFHFTDPPGGPALLPTPFSLVETNFRRDGTVAGDQGFSLVVNPDGTIADVRAFGDITLAGPGIDGESEAPEPATSLFLGVGLAELLRRRRVLTSGDVSRRDRT